jgi:hypothetical protein
MVDRDRSGFVYVIQDESGLVKIGRTRNVERRMKALSTAASSALTLVAFWVCDDAAEREATEHEFWSDCRVRGEWFRIPENILAVWREFSGMHLPRNDDEDGWYEEMYGKPETSR